MQPFVLEVISGERVAVLGPHGHVARPAAARRAPGGGAAAFDGTVPAVTHDRWSARLVCGADGRVYESPEAVREEGRVAGAR